MEDTNKLAGIRGMRFIADANVHVGSWHTIIVCEDTVFALLEYANGVNALSRIHAPANTVHASWCTPITANSQKNERGRGPFVRVQLTSGTIAVYHDSR